MSAPQVRKAWKRIENWCRTNDPRLHRDLNPGATKKEIRDLERAIQQSLPEDVRASLSIHNGQPSTRRRLCFFDGLRLSSCEEIARDYYTWRGYGQRNHPTDDRSYRFYPKDAIQHHHFNDGWIPIIDEEGCGNYLAVDLAPGPAGTVGQVIDFGRDVRDPGVVSSSWGEFLGSYADLLDTVIGVSNDPDNCYEAFDRISCNLNFLDAMVLWAKDGRWPIVRFDPSWRTSTVLALAKSISNNLDFSVMPILADALQDAGCESAAVLNHCRDCKCRRAVVCWVIDTLLSGNVIDSRWCDLH